MASAPDTPSTRSGWFDADDAPAARGLNTCIHCGLCLTACPTYRTLKIEPDSPRGRLYLMRGLAEGRIAPSDPLLTHIDQCLDCRACETVCPAGVPYGRLLEQTRGQLARRAVHRGPTRRLAEWTLRHVFPHRERMHRVADVLRLGQTGLLGALLRTEAARTLMPRFAAHGLALTPPIAPRTARGLERLPLPPGARLERTGPDLRFVPAGVPKARVGFFTSCVMDVMFPEVNREAVRLLVIAGAEVVVPAAQTCCGALHAHAGLRAEARVLASTNARAFADGFDWVVTDSAGCGAALREAGHLCEGDPAAGTLARRTRDIAEVLHALGLPAAAHPRHAAGDVHRPLRVTYHDPCHLAHAQKVREAPRALLRALPGVELVELPNSDWCCGSAGVYNLVHPDLADAQLAGKLDSIAAVSPDAVIASNPGCLLHMRRGAGARGMRVPMRHLVEVLGAAWPA